MSEKDRDAVFETASRRVVRRLMLMRWLAFLGRSSVPVCLAAAVAFILLRLFAVRWDTTLGTLALLLVWMAAATWTFLRRPSPVTALAAWDERAGRHEMFVSAYCFETSARPEDGERLHLDHARGRLDGGLANLHRDLPLRIRHRAWLAPLVLLTAALLGLFQTSLPASEAPMDEDARARARKVAEELEESTKLLEPKKELTPEEKKKLEELKKKLEVTAEKLRKLTDQTPRDVLSELERAAREAEKLAKALGGRQTDFPSSRMIAELERHADTAAFGGALRAKGAEKVASEAEKIAGRLKGPELTIEEHKRVEYALGRAMQVASKPDKASLVGVHLDRAKQELQNERAPQAGEEFDKIAGHFKQVHQRLQAQRQLERLVRNLRGRGQQIFSGNPSGLQSLGPNAFADMQPLGDMQDLPFSGMPLPQWAVGPMPELTEGALMPGMGMDGAWPVPGLGTCPGTGSCTGSFPVPGAKVGGLRAGIGSAAYGKEATKPFDPTGTGVVNPLVSREGPSMVRRIDGRSHLEDPLREARKLAIEFIRAEEEALNEEPLPLTRREQVLRYFTELRRRIENEP
ncbi:MAG: hypothetical protein AMS16_06570 [Planctomycetes bacterium DG_58]|nr:MAG: hypothetical protein AMS16_06570 [Planctomycetes bacterium DG_58]